MQICLVYDCLFPHTVGGGERWYRSLAERLSAAGHDVSYLTLRQWPRGADPGLDGVEVVAVGPRMALYTGGGRRRVLPPLVFGAGVLWHLLRYGRRYDVVHTSSFPYFSLLAAAVARRWCRFGLFVDWFEVWTRGYWRSYLGRVGGWAGWRVQRLCVRVPQRAYCFSRLSAERLRDAGLRGEPIVLPGLYGGGLGLRLEGEPEPFLLFAGRHIPEKQVTAIPAAVMHAREAMPDLRAVILGDGPTRGAVERSVAELGLGEAIEVPGFVDAARVAELMGRALCVVLPSRREGYGLVVIEAAARGTPSIVVAGPDNAATELISEGVNGYVAASASPEDLAEGVGLVRAAGGSLRASTAAWFAENAERLSVGHSVAVVEEQLRLRRG